MSTQIRCEGCGATYLHAHHDTDTPHLNGEVCTRRAREGWVPCGEGLLTVARRAHVRVESEGERYGAGGPFPRRWIRADDAESRCRCAIAGAIFP